jgi:branched-chain amino acid transport system substrate-binding protein
MGDQQAAVAPYLSKQDILWICGFGTDPEQLALGDKWMISYPGTTYNAAIQIGDYAYSQGWRKMTTLSHDYIAGYTHVAGFADRFKELGGTVIQQQWVPYGTPDYAPYLNALDPQADVLAVAIWIPDLLTLMRQHGEFGLKIPMVIDEIDAMNLGHIRQLGQYALGKKGIIRMCSVALDYPKTPKFVERFRAKYGEDPVDSAACGYVPMALLLAGLQATGGDPSREAMFEALQKVKLDSPFGPIALSPTGSGLVVSNRWMAEIKKKDGKNVFEIEETYEAIMDPRDKPGWLERKR